MRQWTGATREVLQTYHRQEVDECNLETAIGIKETGHVEKSEVLAQTSDDRNVRCANQQCLRKPHELTSRSGKERTYLRGDPVERIDYYTRVDAAKDSTDKFAVLVVNAENTVDVVGDQGGRCTKNDQEDSRNKRFKEHRSLSRVSEQK